MTSSITDQESSQGKVIRRGDHGRAFTNGLKPHRLWPMLGRGGIAPPPRYQGSASRQVTPGLPAPCDRHASSISLLHRIFLSNEVCISPLPLSATHEVPSHGVVGKSSGLVLYDRRTLQMAFSLGAILGSTGMAVIQSRFRFGAITPRTGFKIPPIRHRHQR